MSSFATKALYFGRAMDDSGPISGVLYDSCRLSYWEGYIKNKMNMLFLYLLIAKMLRKVFHLLIFI